MTEPSPATRTLLRLAFGVLSFALVAGVWELVARQAPGSPLYIGMLPGPISSLRETATVLGLLLLSVAQLVPMAARRREPRGLFLGVLAGSVVGLGASVYAAAVGMHGVQFNDPLRAALPVFALKQGGLGLALGCLLELGRRAVFQKTPREPR